MLVIVQNFLVTLEMSTINWSAHWYRDTAFVLKTLMNKVNMI